MNRYSSAALVIAAMGLSSAAFAADSKPEQKAAITTSDLFDKLPKAKLEIPKTATLPKSIPVSEKVDGFYVEVPPHYKGVKEGPTYAMVYASSEDAAARNTGQETGGGKAPTCFMNAYPNYGQEINWSASFGTSTSVQNYRQQQYPGSPQLGSVNLVRSDHIVKEEKDKLEYEVKLAYVDAETMGVRLLSKQTLQFTLLNELPGRVKVWGSKSDDQVMFLVRREKHEKERFFNGPLMVTVNGQHVMSSAEACPVIFSMKTGKNVSASAVVQLEALLDIVDVQNEDGDSNAGLPRPPTGANGQREAKVRPMRIGISNSWMSQDTKPVVSVSHGWSGRERTQPI